MLTSLFSLFYVTGEFHRFLHWGWAKIVLHAWTYYCTTKKDWGSLLIVSHFFAPSLPSDLILHWFSWFVCELVPLFPTKCVFLFAPRANFLVQVILVAVSFWKRSKILQHQCPMSPQLPRNVHGALKIVSWNISLPTVTATWLRQKLIYHRSSHMNLTAESSTMVASKDLPPQFT